MNNVGQVEIEVLSGFADARGLLFEPLNEHELMQQRNVHVVLSEPGAIRGNHFHQAATELTTLVGPALIRLRENGVVRDLQVPAGETWRLRIPPRVVHAFQNTGAASMVLVSFSSAVHDPQNPDTVREAIL